MKTTNCTIDEIVEALKAGYAISHSDRYENGRFRWIHPKTNRVHDSLNPWDWTIDGFIDSLYNFGLADSDDTSKYVIGMKMSNLSIEEAKQALLDGYRVSHPEIATYCYLDNGHVYSASSGFDFGSIDEWISTISNSVSDADKYYIYSPTPHTSIKLEGFYRARVEGINTIVEVRDSVSKYGVSQYYVPGDEYPRYIGTIEFYDNDPIQFPAN